MPSHWDWDAGRPNTKRARANSGAVFVRALERRRPISHAVTRSCFFSSNPAGPAQKRGTTSLAAQHANEQQQDGYEHSFSHCPILEFSYLKLPLPADRLGRKDDGEAERSPASASASLRNRPGHIRLAFPLVFVCGAALSAVIAVASQTGPFDLPGPHKPQYPSPWHTGLSSAYRSLTRPSSRTTMAAIATPTIVIGGLPTAPPYKRSRRGRKLIGAVKMQSERAFV